MAVIGDQVHENKVNNTLCHDIIELILHNLPVKSLLRFKTVCKTWWDLISNPRFANNNLACCDHNVSRIHLSLYGCSYRVVEAELQVKIQCRSVPPWYFSVPLNDANCSDIQVVETSNPFNVPMYWIKVAGSCNGLLFVTVREKTFLWNPSIREHVQLPPTNAMLDLQGCRKIAGLGYNSVFDEYKAVLFLYECKRQVRVGRSQLLVYNSRVGYWREVDQDVPYCLNKTCDSGVAVNGYPHWIVHHSNDFSYSKPIIMFFDTVDDKFKRLPTPLRWCNFDPSLSVLRRCLCASGKNLINSTTDVWVMNKYGVEDSWIKLLVIPDSIISGSSIVPLGFMNHGHDLVLEVNVRKIMTYNLKTKEKKFVIGTAVRQFALQNDRLKSVEYVASLVSPCRFSTRGKKEEEVSKKKQKVSHFGN